MNGAQLREQMLQAGAPAAEVQAWEDRLRTQMLQSGAPAEEVAEYFGYASPPDTSRVDNFMQGNYEAIPDAQRATVLATPQNAFSAGWDMSLTGLSTRLQSGQGMPEYTPTNLWDTIRMMAGQFVGDAPVAIPSFFTGAAAGAPLGAPGGPIGVGVASMAAGSGASALATEGARQILIDQIRENTETTHRTLAERTAEIAWNTAMATVVGTVAGAAGGATGGKLATLGVGRLGSETANASVQGVVAAGSFGAVQGRMPTWEEFAAGGVLALGAAAGTMVLARSGRHVFKPSPAGEHVIRNLQTIYARTGMHPRDAVNRAVNDPALRTEIIGGVQEDGTPVTPGFDSLRQAGPYSRITNPLEVNPVRRGDTQPLEPRPAEGAEPKPAQPTPEQLAAELPKDFIEAHTRILGDPPAEVIRQYGFDPGKMETDPVYADNVRRVIIQNNRRIFADDADGLVAYRMGDQYTRAWVRGGRKFEDLPIEVQKALQRGEAEGMFDKGYNLRQEDAQLRAQGDGDDWLPSRPRVLEGEILPSEDGGTGGRPPPPRDADDITPPPTGNRRVETTHMEMSPEMAAAKIRDIIAPPDAGPGWTRLLDPRRIIAEFEGQLAPARRMDRAMKAAPEDFAIEDLFRTVYGARERAGYFVRYGTLKVEVGPDGLTPINVRQVNDKSIRKAFRTAKEAGGNLDDFIAFRIALRTIEKAKQGIETGIPLEVAQRVANDPDFIARYREAANIIRDVKDASIEYAVDAGRFTRAQADAMKALNREHITFRRVIDPDYVSPVRRRGTGKLHKMKGSERQIHDTTEADIDNLHTIIAMADRNRARLAVLNRIAPPRIDKRLPKPGREGERAIGQEKPLEGELLDSDGKPIVTKVQEYDTTTLRQRAGKVETDDGRVLTDAELDALSPFLAERVLGKDLKPNEFLVFRDGKAEKWSTTDPDLAKLMVAQWEAPGGMNAVAEFAAFFAKMTRLGVIGEPVFVMRTTAYGQLSSSAMGRQKGVPFHDVVLGSMSIWKNGLTKYREWARNGGAGSALVDLDRKYLSRDIKAVWDDTGVGGRVLNVVRHPIEAVVVMHHMVDAVARLGHTIRMERKGMPPVKAALESRTAYLDYGEPLARQWVNTWSRVTPFMGTGLREWGQVSYAFTRKFVATATAVAAVFVTPTVMNYAINRYVDQFLPENERYGNQPQWLRDLYWVLPPINGVRLKIRKPWIPGTFATLAERFLQASFDDDPEWAEGLMDSVRAQITPPAMPAVITPILENYFNVNTLTGRPMVPDSLEPASGYMQYLPDTSDTAKAVARYLGDPGINFADLSPIVIENYARDWTGAIPFSLLRSVEAGLKAARGDRRGEPKQFADLPFVGSFFVRENRAGHELDKFYSGMERLRQADRDFRLAIERRNLQEIRDTTKLQAFIRLNTLSDRISKAQEWVRLINDSDMTDDEKMKYTDNIMRLIYGFSKVGNAYIRALDEAAGR